jgi:endonuclease/exonuclease/phosphatase family metal-dependent hydrolase
MLIAAYAANYINPQYFWPFAFFGLAYPYLFAINLILLIFWIWRRKWTFLISLMTIIAGWSNVGRYVQIRIFENQAIESADLKLLSFNVRLFNYYQWEKRADMRYRILRYINIESPDVVAFQDFFTSDVDKRQNESYTDSLMAAYPWKHVLYTYKKNNVFNYGMATYSRFPIVKQGSIRFSDSYNSCIYSDISVNDDTLRIYNVHLQSIKFRKNYYYFTDSLATHLNANRIDEVKDISDHLKVAFIKRAQQVDELEQHIRRSPYPVIICGDFNDTPVSYTYQHIRGDLTDAFRESGSGFGNTYRGNIPSFRIDYIFHSPEFNSVLYQTHKVAFSDHYPVSCGIMLQYQGRD